jgi:hypothetical protein
MVAALLLFSLAVSAQTSVKDTLKKVSSTGVFSGKKVFTGNFKVVEVYKINDYCISPEYLTERQADSLKGKKIRVSGILKIVEGEYHSAKTSTDGKIYEPYKEPDKKFIEKPVFTIINPSR